MELTQKIEELIYQNADDFEVAKVIKKSIKEYLLTLEKVYERDQGKSFLVKHTKNIDSIIKATYKYVLRVFFKEFTPLSNTLPISLVALGSYGREQLCVYSDIDIMIVYKELPGYNTEEIIQKFLQILWDSGLKLGHRVHKLEELEDATQTDHTIKTAIIESRFIYGSNQLYFMTQNSILKIQKTNQKEFVLAKLDEFTKRRKTHPFSMEPNIKSSPGGLRDFNTIFWIAKTLYNVPKVKDLPNHIISYNQYTSLRSSVEFLYRLRSAMHLVSGKKQDKLILENLPAISKKLNLSDRKVMRKTIGAMHNIRNISKLVIKKLVKSILFNKDNIKKLKNSNIYPHIFLCENKIFSNLKNKKLALSTHLKLLYPLINKQNIKYDISYIYSLSTAKIDEENLNLKELFSKKYTYQTLKALYNANVLTKIIPPLRKVKHLEQFDGYHKYPVDIHSLQSIEALENISEKNIKELFDALSPHDKMILKIATLLHDCGKGRKQDHSILGANIAKKFALNINLSLEDADTIYTLIRNHTIMSNTANREDIYSDKVVFNFLSKIKNQRNLTLLYILTYADIESVSKGTYSNLNANLIRELYQISLESLKSNTKIISEATKRAKKENILKRDSSFKNLPKLLQKKILSIESNLLFFKYDLHKIIEISKWVYELKKPYDYKITTNPSLTIEIIRSDEFNLGYFLSKLSYLSVLNMDIFKIFNSIKYFKIEFLENISDELDIYRIKQLIEDSFDMQKKSSLQQITIKKDEIKIDCLHSRSYASLKLNTKDQKGILANISAVFDDIGVDIASAKIQTIKNRTRNLFLIEKNGNFCKNKEEIVKKICVE